MASKKLAKVDIGKHFGWSGNDNKNSDVKTTYITTYIFVCRLSGHTFANHTSYKCVLRDVVYII